MFFRGVETTNQMIYIYILSRFKNNVTAVPRESGMFGTYGWYVRMVGTVFLVQPLVRTIGTYSFLRTILGTYDWCVRFLFGTIFGAGYWYGWSEGVSFS